LHLRSRSSSTRRLILTMAPTAGTPAGKRAVGTNVTLERDTRAPVSRAAAMCYALLARRESLLS